MPLFRVLVLYQHENVGTFLNLHRCTFKEKIVGQIIDTNIIGVVHKT